jgi:hypothetical protein
MLTHLTDQQRKNRVFTKLSYMAPGESDTYGPHRVKKIERHMEGNRVAGTVLVNGTEIITIKEAAQRFFVYV